MPGPERRPGPMNMWRAIPCPPPIGEGMRPVAENDRLVLYLREETSEVAVKCKETGAVFTSTLNRAEIHRLRHQPE